MSKTKNTKSALLMSFTSLLLCFAMLIGSTFAWFTDSATTAVNTIKSGTLDVALEMKDASGNWVNAEGETLSWVKAAGASANEQVLWEPGCTYELPELRIKNNGNLALKYKIQITGIQGDAKLNEAIEWTINNDGQTYAVDQEVSLSANDSDTLTIKGHMKKTAGNEYQNLSIDNIGITVVATQDTVEYDSNGNQYDARAGYPVSAEVSDSASLTEALNNPGVPVSITLTETIGSSRDLTVTGDVTLNLGQNRLNQSNMAIVGADLTVNNGGSLVINATSPEGWAYNAGKLMADGSGSSLTVNGGAYGDSGANNADVTARNGSVVYLKSGSFSTSGAYGHAVTAESGATVYISGGSFSTSGYQSSTIYANGGTIVITGLDSISANGFNYDVDNGGTIILSKAVSSSQPTRIGTGCTVTDDGDNWVITKA